ncbi:MAG: hypothetical protein R3F20_02090 [Planctomycetota bacterium]
MKIRAGAFLGIAAPQPNLELLHVRLPGQRESRPEDLEEALTVLGGHPEAFGLRHAIRDDERLEREGLVVVPSRVGRRFEIDRPVANRVDHRLDQFEVARHRLALIELLDEIDLR